MVRGMYRSRTFRRVSKKTPGHRNIISYRKRKPAKAHCASCGGLLHGVPRERPYKIARISKTQRRPERPYGGVLCSKCSRLFIKSKISSSK